METNNQIAVIGPKQKAVEMRRGMLNQPAVMGVLEPVERAVFIASTAKTISEYTGQELATELNTALKWILKDIGYRSTDESDRQYLVIRTAEILKRYYGNLTLKDFRMAFEMSVTGELDDFLPKGRDGQPDRNHYQQVNADYVCKILNAYKGRRAWVLKKANDAVPKGQAERNEEQERIIRDQTRRDLCECFVQYKETGRMPEISPIAEMLYYDILAKAGLAPEISVTIEEQRQILQHTINEFALKGNVGDVRRLKELGTDAEEIQFGAYRLARKKALLSAFDSLIRDDVELEF